MVYSYVHVNVADKSGAYLEIRIQAVDTESCLLEKLVIITAEERSKLMSIVRALIMPGLKEG
jgi:hypothetical protein